METNTSLAFNSLGWGAKTKINTRRTATPFFSVTRVVSHTLATFQLTQPSFLLTFEATKGVQVSPATAPHPLRKGVESDAYVGNIFVSHGSTFLLLIYFFRGFVMSTLYAEQSIELHRDVYD